MITKKERTREAILDAVYPLFATRGFSRLTMKDICEATGLSRGGLYSHFASVKDVFEAILVKINQKAEMNFQEEIAAEVPATVILKRALSLMEDEMNHPEDSLSLAMYEYAGSVESDLMAHFNQIGEDKWTALIEYGMARDEFKKVNVTEMVNIILYAYQGVRMWSCIIPMTPETMESVTSHIRTQLVKE